LRKNITRQSHALLVVIVLLRLVATVQAQTGDDYSLNWNTVDGGGEMYSAGGAYTLGGTVGQPDAGVLEGGTYTLAGGFWGGASAVHRLYLPLLLRDV
jgi:hypothetical protein